MQSLISSHWTNGSCIPVTLSLLQYFPIIFFIINCAAGCFAGTFLNQTAACDDLWLQLSNILTLTGSLWGGGGDVQTLLTQSSRRWEFKTEVRHHPAHPSVRQWPCLSHPHRCRNIVQNLGLRFSLILSDESIWNNSRVDSLPLSSPRPYPPTQFLSPSLPL